MIREVGSERRSNPLPGFIGQCDGTVEGFEVLIDIATDLPYLRQLLFESSAVSAHAQMQPDRHPFKKRQFPVHRLGDQPGGFPAIGHHQHRDIQSLETAAEPIQFKAAAQGGSGTV